MCACPIRYRQPASARLCTRYHWYLFDSRPSAGRLKRFLPYLFGITMNLLQKIVATAGLFTLALGAAHAQSQELVCLLYTSDAADE